MNRIACLGLAALALGLTGCDEGANIASPAGTAVLEFNPVFDITTLADGGTCPDVFYESEQELDNGVTVTWTSAFGGFDYTLGDVYTGQVAWSVDQGSATLSSPVGFGTRTPNQKGKRNSWTPRGQDPVDGTMALGAAGTGTQDVDVSMDPMHRGDEDVDGDGTNEWEGLIGNGHFWLWLDVDDGAGNVESAKFGVNFHLEDPDEGFLDRCPS